MNTFTNLKGTVGNSLVVITIVASLTGCGSENVIAPSRFGADLQAEGKLSDAVNATPGQVYFETARSAAVQTLSLGEVSLLTPYLAGTKSVDSASLAELSALTPVIVKFQTAFNAEVAKLSVGQVGQMEKYMQVMGMTKTPYPQIEDGSGDPSIA